MVDHDAKDGVLGRCQISGSHELFEVINLGHQPLCDAILRFDQLYEPEVSYPLSLNLCPSSGLAQLGYVVPAGAVYPPEYPYRAGVSQTVVDAHALMAKNIYNRFAPNRVIDIGCNDGTLLKQFKALGCEVIGVEPTSVGEIARKDGIDVVDDFFTEEIAKEIRQVSGLGDIIIMTNVFAHMADLGEVMRGILALLRPEGVLIIENHYLLDILEKDQFDTIYHEHIRTYSLKALKCLFDQYGLEIFEVERAPRYGGNIRVYVGYPGYRAVQPSVWELLEHERKSGLFDELTWAKWRSRVLMHRDHFMEWICRMHRMGASVRGCSAPGRAATLLNFYGVTRDLMPYTGEVPNSLKLGHYYPGCHIPIVPNTRLLDEQPSYVVLLAWHYAEYIHDRVRREGLKSCLVSPLPEFYFRSDPKS